MTPAERLAALRAIKEGLDGAIKDAEAEVDAVMGATGADRFSTDLGKVIKAVRKPSIRFDEDRLLDFAERMAEWEVETIKRVRQTFRDQFVAEGGAIIYVPTGEEADVGTIKVGTEYLTVRLNDEAKRDAMRAIKDRTDAVVNLLQIGS